MKTTIIAFDVDGTLISNEVQVRGGKLNEADIPHQHIIDMLKTLARFKNIKIVVWSGGGKQYAENWVYRLGLEDFVWRCASKTEAPEIKPDIAIDDIHDTQLGFFNLIVRNK